MRLFGSGAWSWCALLFAGLQVCSAAQKDTRAAGNPAEQNLRVGMAGGMGVSYLSMTDVVDLANATPGNYQRLPEFKSAVEFFGAATVPVSPDWVLKLEYAYILASYNVTTSFGNGQAEYTVTAHLPSLIVQYVLLNEHVYNVKVGAGAGYHFGSLDAKFFTQDDRYSGDGPGVVLDAEGNTAFGESLYAYLGVNLRWDFIGAITNDMGMPPGTAGDTITGPTMQFFGLGARLGFTFYF
ncbi:MAG: hypothetical protein H6Q30_196 [Bacteroidetes bacterium]|nr:hypothetical protein [Bacteroidota bacterium]